MSRIITIGREFGSGGREVGRCLTEKLNITYYHNEIVLELVERIYLTEEYIKQIEKSRSIPLLPITIGRTFSPQLYPMVEQNQSVYREQSNIIREMAGKSDCVIVGRCTNYILRKEMPLRVFVYASMDFKIARCVSVKITFNDIWNCRGNLTFV
ncbi:MAG: cytidylate kinase-like family protein [Lachnospiraceae bacterium]|nr:cytidylate kinase-like family protein [Lachnospiraceae bacterium]